MKFNLLGRSELWVELSILVLFCVTIFLTMLNTLSDDALLCATHNSAFIKCTRVWNLPSLPSMAQTLSILASWRRSSLPSTWYSTNSSLSLSRPNRSCGRLFPSSMTAHENEQIKHKWAGDIIACSIIILCNFWSWLLNNYHHHLKKGMYLSLEKIDAVTLDPTRSGFGGWCCRGGMQSSSLWSQIQRSLSLLCDTWSDQWLQALYDGLSVS